MSILEDLLAGVPPRETPPSPPLPATRTVLAAFPIEPGSPYQFRIVLTEHDGQRRIDLRRWWFSARKGEWQATRQGVTLPPRAWDLLVRAIIQAQQRLQDE